MWLLREPIIRALGLNPDDLEAVKREQIPVLPFLIRGKVDNRVTGFSSAGPHPSRATARLREGPALIRRAQPSSCATSPLLDGAF
jgi:hypothetical protein